MWFLDIDRQMSCQGKWRFRPLPILNNMAILLLYITYSFNYGKASDVCYSWHIGNNKKGYAHLMAKKNISVGFGKDVLSPAKYWVVPQDQTDIRLVQLVASCFQGNLSLPNWKTQLESILIQQLATNQLRLLPSVFWQGHNRTAALAGMQRFTLSHYVKEDLLDFLHIALSASIRPILALKTQDGSERVVPSCQLFALPIIAYSKIKIYIFFVLDILSKISASEGG